MNGENQSLMALSPSPHVKHKNTTQSIMRDVLIAMSGAFVWSVVVFGYMAAVLTVLSVLLCVFYEFAYQKLMRKPVTVSDLSAAVTGVLIAFNVPVNIAPWVLVFGCFFAIVVVKQLFGGIGKNVVNPAIAARIFMFVCWPSEMSSFFKADAITSSTPLASIKNSVIPDYTVGDAFFGFIPGCLGEVSALLLICGGVYLLIRRVITPQIPLAFIGTVAVFYLALSPVGTPVQSLGYGVFTGGLMLGAIFMATDYTTSPVTPVGRVIFGVGCGLITVAIRFLGAYPEGVSFAIMIMNLLVHYIDKATMPKVFGMRKQKNG